MLKFLTAYTREADEAEAAVREIQKQLNLEKEGLAHSAALLFCHYALIESGIAAAVSKSLSCAVLGGTSLYFALPEAADEIMLTVTLLTSDDIEFAAGVSEPLGEKNTDAAVEALYRQTTGSLNGEPNLIFAILPMMLNLSAEVMTAALNHVCGGIPVFGTSALDMDKDIRNPRTIYRDAAYTDRLVLLLLKGPVKPRFYSYPFPDQPVFAQDAVVTGAEANRILSINNNTAASFLQELGLVRKNGDILSAAVPLVVDCHDGAGYRVVIIKRVGPRGELISSSHVPVGGVLNIGAITPDHVLESAKALIQDIKKTENGAGIFIFSCFLRSIVLGGNNLAEIDLIRKELDDFPIPYLFLYAGGELCPWHSGNGEAVNRIYLYTLIACQF